MPDFTQASAHIYALTQNANAVIDFRAIHDSDKAAHGVNFRGTLAQHWNDLCRYNAAGYGIFFCVNQMDGQGRDYANVTAIRAHFVDLDTLDAMQNLARADAWYPSPSFAVQSSPGKAHVYWPVQSYLDNTRFSNVQRKLITLFGGDPSIIDAPRVMRLAGFDHRKGAPQPVTCWALSGSGYVNPVETLETALTDVSAPVAIHTRDALGDPDKAAPSLEWLSYALSQVDPNDLDRDEWIALTCAVKQAGWTLTDEATLFGIWSDWCARYGANDIGENQKQWRSIGDTQLGWQSILNRVPSIKPQFYFHGQQREIPSGASPEPTPPRRGPENAHKYGAILNEEEQREFFDGCTWISQSGKILTPKIILMGANEFNGTYGGKYFITNSEGKMTDEPWKAALRSTMWTVPKVDHIRFLPHEPQGQIVTDELGRRGVNSYVAPAIQREKGDVSLFERHLEMILPSETDRQILLQYMAHNAKFPGFKIPWAPLIQSEEGAGKGILKAIYRHIVSSPYFYSPNARELADSGAKFNAWMRNKLFILVDEIRVDEKRDMVETLKPMISEPEIEMQGKGENQGKEDNYSNWAFFSNYKDAIPVHKNGRRFSIFYSAIQSTTDLELRGMNKAYFDSLYQWLGAESHRNGLRAIAQYLYEYPVERGQIPMRAPDTTSTKEALRKSMTVTEQVISDAIEGQEDGFRNGYVSSLAVNRVVKANDLRQMSPKNIADTLERMSYRHIGKAPRSYFQEDPQRRADLYASFDEGHVEQYGRAQGYE